MIEYPYYHINPFDLNAFCLKLVNQKKSKVFADLVITETFLKLWTLLHKYGDIYILPPTHDSNNLFIPDVYQNCIGFSSYAAFGESADKRQSLCHYVEGITTQACFSIHAWVASHGSKHKFCHEATRVIDRVNIPNFEGHGIPFDREFFEYAIKQQFKWPHEQYQHLLDGSKSILSWKPLIDGKIDHYRYTESDIEEAVSVLPAFAEKAASYNSVADDVLYQKLKGASK